MILDAKSEVKNIFSNWEGTNYGKVLSASGDTMAEELLEVLKNYAFIFTYRDTGEIFYIQNNEFRPAETELKQLTKEALSAMKMSVSSHFYEEVLKFIQLRTYIDREEIEAWGDIIGFKNAVYIDLNHFYIVKPAISYLRRIIAFLGKDYNRYTRGFGQFIEMLDNEDETAKQHISPVDHDHFAEDEYEDEFEVEVEREQRGTEHIIIHVERDFNRLLDILPIRRLPVEFDPTATAPTWEEFIRTSVPPQFRDTLQRFAGYCLLPTKKYGRFLALLGNGNNGKSTFITILTEIFGKHASSISMQDIVDGKFKLAELEGKMVNIYPDLPKKKIFNTGLFKALITDELPFTVERKFKPTYQAKIMAKFIFGANQLPSVNDDSFAFFRRWLIVNFPRIFDRKTADPDLLEKLRAEKSGILNWIIAGAYALVHSPENPFEYPYTEEEIAEKYYRAESPVAAFVQDCLYEGDDPQDPEARIEKDRLYSIFIKYCKNQGLPSVSLGKFTKDLKKHIPVSIMRIGTPGNRYYVYAGIKLLEDCEDGKMKKVDDWDEETDFYKPEALPVELFRVWPSEVKEYVIKEEVKVGRFTLHPGEVFNTLFIPPRIAKELLEAGKLQEVDA